MRSKPSHIPLRSRACAAACAIVTLATALPARPVRAEVLTWSDQARREIEGDLESPQLRTLRLLEREWFGSGPQDRPEHYEPDCVVGTPDSLSSSSPPDTIEREGEMVDLSWLSELALPNIPVRWDSRVIDYLLFFKNDPSGRALLASWLRRQEIYGPMIRRVLAEHALPSDLQYVAMVESGFDPRARSYVAAQGLWQFMRRAGTHYGLRIDRWVDERLDPEKATHAAVRFLKELHRRFGSWELAFAAYNMGYGGLLRSIRKYNTNDYWVLSHLEAGLPYETALYVSKITAVAIIAHNKDRFGFGAIEMIEPQPKREVEVAAGTYLKHVAVAAGVEPEVVVDLNPDLRKRRVPPDVDTWHVTIPADSFDRFAHRFRHRKPTVPRTHTLRFGESFEDVARLYETTPRRLRHLNDLEPDERVYVGEVLFVPPNKARRERPPEPPQVAAVPRDFEVEGKRRIFYRTSSHDTPGEIARFFEVSEADLYTWNQLAPGADLQSGMFLQLYVDPELDLSKALVLTPDEVTVLTTGSQDFFDFHEKQRGRVRIRYVCQEGDTLERIGERFELSAGSIARINQFSSRHELEPGETILVYVPEEQLPALVRKGLVAPPKADDEEAEPGAPAESEPSARSTPAPAPKEPSERTEGEPPAELAEAETRPTETTEGDGAESPDATEDGPSIPIGADEAADLIARALRLAGEDPSP